MGAARPASPGCGAAVIPGRLGPVVVPVPVVAGGGGIVGSSRHRGVGTVGDIVAEGVRTKAFVRRKVVHRHRARSRELTVACIVGCGDAEL